MRVGVTGELRDCIGTGEEGTGRMKLNPSVGQSGDTGEGETEDELEPDEAELELEPDEVGEDAVGDAESELDSIP